MKAVQTQSTGQRAAKPFQNPPSKNPSFHTHHPTSYQNPDRPTSFHFDSFPFFTAKPNPYSHPHILTLFRFDPFLLNPPFFLMGVMMMMMMWFIFLIGAVCCGAGEFGFEEGLELDEMLFNLTELGVSSYSVSKPAAAGGGGSPVMVGLTLIHSAAAKQAVCLDGSLPGYHFSPGFGSGSRSWLVQLEGGGWCNTIRNCVYRKKTRRGSSAYMERAIPFTGILSNSPQQNPDFFNWNRVKIRYCDGASFTGDSYDAAHQIHFKGQRIWWAAMEELLSKGMKYANQALLSGCSAGGLASIVHCDEFRGAFSRKTKVKCLSDGGLFLDAVDVAGGHSLRDIFSGVVGLQGSQKNLPHTCTNHRDPASCFFPQNLIANIRTPMFLVNAAYDSWQIQASLAPHSADPHGYWTGCKMNHAQCSAPQILFLQRFRNQMLNAVKGFSLSGKNGLFINSCFAHCQTERQDTWFSDNSPLIGNKGIAIAVGDWYFDREGIKAIDCAYPCDKTCHNLVFR